MAVPRWVGQLFALKARYEKAQKGKGPPLSDKEMETFIRLTKQLADAAGQSMDKVGDAAEKLDETMKVTQVDVPESTDSTSVSDQVNDAEFSKIPSAQEWVNSFPKGTKKKIKDWLNSDLGARQNEWKEFKKAAPKQKQPWYGDRTEFADTPDPSEGHDDLIDERRKARRKRSGLREMVDPSRIPDEGLPPDEFEQQQQQARDEKESEKLRNATEEAERRKAQQEYAESKARNDRKKYDNPFGPNTADQPKPKSKYEEQREKVQTDTNYEYQRKKDQEEANRIAAEKRAQQQADAEKQREEMQAHRMQALENLSDEALNTASEGPISEGGGAASGSNMGKFARRIKTAGGRIYNAFKGRRPGRKQFNPPRGSRGLGGSKGVGGKGAGLGKGAGGTGGKPPIPPGGAGAAGAAGAGGAGGAAGAAGGGGAGALAGAGAMLGPAMAVAGLGIAAVEAGKAVYEFARAQEEVVRKLAQYGGQQAVAVAKLDVDRQFRDIKTAQETGGSSQQLTQSITNFENALRPIESLLTNIGNSLSATMLDVIRDILIALQPITDVLKAIYEILPGDHDDISTKVQTAFDTIDRLNEQQQTINAPHWPTNTHTTSMR